MSAVRDSEGAYNSVTDDEIRWAMREVGRLAGIFAEPAAAAAVAGVAKAARDGVIDSKASVVAYISGNGLKDTPAAISAAGAPIDISPNLDEVKRAVKS